MFPLPSVATLLAGTMTLIGPAVVIRVGPARDDGERNADAPKEARSEFHCISTIRALFTFDGQLMNVQS